MEEGPNKNSTAERIKWLNERIQMLEQKIVDLELDDDDYQSKLEVLAIEKIDLDKELLRLEGKTSTAISPLAEAILKQDKKK